MKQIEENHYNVRERVIVKRLARKGYNRSSDSNKSDNTFLTAEVERIKELI